MKGNFVVHQDRTRQSMEGVRGKTAKLLVENAFAPRTTDAAPTMDARVVLSFYETFSPVCSFSALRWFVCVVRSFFSLSPIESLTVSSAPPERASHKLRYLVVARPELLVENKFRRSQQDLCSRIKPGCETDVRRIASPR